MRQTNPQWSTVLEPKKREQLFRLLRRTPKKEIRSYLGSQE